MTFDEAVTAVESLEFGFETSLASGLHHFREIIHHAPAVRALFELARDREGLQRRLLARLLQLTELRHDPRYEHPWDAPMATYLWILSQTAPELAAIAAEPITSSRTHWWARKIAEAVLFSLPEHTDSGSFEVAVESSPDLAIKQTDPASDAVLFGGLFPNSPGVDRVRVWPHPDLAAAA